LNGADSNLEQSSSSSSSIAPWKHFQKEGFKDVHKDSMEWERDEDTEAFVEELLDESRVSEIPEGIDEAPITHIKLTRSLFRIKGPTDLFIRPFQKELWTEAMSSLIPYDNRHLLITGNPGIGKSVSLLYFLRMLLLEQKLVIVELRKDYMVYAFVPPQLQGKKKA